MTQIIEALSEISDRYDALFVDLWGCLHDGIRPFPPAVAALQAFRARGGKVVLLTNSPRPRGAVARQIDRIGVARDSWDIIATSGDSARAAMFEGAVGRNVYHIGPPQDESFFEEMALIDNPVDIRRVPLDEAEGIVLTGPFDDANDKPEDYRETFLLAKQRRLKLLCANPDIVVDRGDQRVYCAGALAALYTEMGGESLYFGKPHPPIYDLARRRLASLGEPLSDSLILAIGDGIHTDVQGATGEDLDVLFVTGGLAAAETGTRADGQPDPQRLSDFLGRARLSPPYAIGALR